MMFGITTFSKEFMVVINLLFFQFCLILNFSYAFISLLQNPEVVENFIQKLSKSVQTVNFLPVDGSLRLPPASFQTFLKEDPNIPGFILTNDYKKFNNRYATLLIQVLISQAIFRDSWKHNCP